MNLNDPYCQKCHSRNIQKACVMGDEKFECKKCGNEWGWYYDRNLPENKNKAAPHPTGLPRA